jgi:hypothetical protein
MPIRARSAVVFLAALAFALLAMLLFGGCSTTIPIGDNGRYGTIGIDVSYQFADILAEQPNIGGGK